MKCTEMLFEKNHVKKQDFFPYTDFRHFASRFKLPTFEQINSNFLL